MLESLYYPIHRFLEEYFIRPMYTRSGYNAYNTLLYAFLLGVGTEVAYRYGIKPAKLKVDWRMFTAFIPAMVFGATVRALVDGKVLPENPLLLTPGIALVILAALIPGMIIDVKLKTYPWATVVSGSALSSWAIYLFVVHAKNWDPYGYTLLYTAVAWSGVFLWYRVMPFDKLYLYVVLAHLFDMGSTVSGIYYYHYHEVHWIEHHLVQWFGPFVYYPWMVFILIIIYYGLKWLVPDENERHFWYLVVFLVGLGPAIRDPAQMVLQI